MEPHQSLMEVKSWAVIPCLRLWLFQISFGTCRLPRSKWMPFGPRCKGILSQAQLLQIAIWLYQAQSALHVRIWVSSYRWCIWLM